MNTIKRIAFFLLFSLFVLTSKAQFINQAVDSLIHLITVDSYRAHFDSLRTDQFCNRKVISSTIQSTDHNKCRDYIYHQFQTYLGTENVYLHEFGSNDYRGLANVIGFKKGKDKNAGIWIIGAHYDSNNSNEKNLMSKIISPGANDNGTGIAAILELARITSKLETNASILFAAWDLEEIFTNGKATGSNSWFEEYITRKKGTKWEYLGNGATINQNDLKANLNFDMFGNPQVEDEGKPVLWACYATNSDIAFVENYVSIVNSYVPEIEAKLFGKLIFSDHYTFSSRKIQSVENLESGYQNDPFYHTYSDNLQNPNNIDMQFATNVTRGGLAFLLENILPQSGEPYISAFQKANIHYAENPEKYFIELPENDVAVKLLNCYGQTQKFTQENGYLSFSPLTTGLYFIQINGNTEISTGILYLYQKERPATGRSFH